MTCSPAIRGWILPLMALVLTTGCDSPKKPTASKTKPREVINKTTQEVMKLADALAQGGQVAEGGGTVGPSGGDAGYLGAIAEANRSARGTISTLAVQQALQVYDIQNGKPVQDYDEFMAMIIKPGQADGIQLPQLPYYQSYAYDEAERKLVVVEFPQKKAEYEKQSK
jgi:hypothetical protein